ncbi:flotillin family protein, partial [Streptomonospora nanhaiensis]
MDPLILAGVIVGAIILLFILLRTLYKVAEPNEALLISGWGVRVQRSETADSLGFKIITGKGVLVIPG